MSAAHFRSELESLINRNSMENGSNTPDFVLAKYLEACLAAFDDAVRQRETWHGRACIAPAPPPSTGGGVRSDGASEECTDCGASRYVFRVYGCGSCTCPMKTPAPVPASATPQACAACNGSGNERYVGYGGDECVRACSFCNGTGKRASAAPGETPPNATDNITRVGRNCRFTDED